MKRYLLIFFLLIVITGFCPAEDVPVSNRTWNYASLNLALKEDLSWMVLGGFRYEFSSELNGESLDEKEMYFYEFFTGPMFHSKLGKFKLIVPVWYYYMGFPMNSIDKYTYSHNLEILPILVYKRDNLIFYNRLIFHNTLYSSFYKEVMGEEDLQSGYSLLLRWKCMLQYIISPSVILEIATEPFYGVIEDDEKVPVTGPGFSEQGLDMVRIYTGFIYNFSKATALETNYVFETSYAEDPSTGDKELTQVAHYIFLTLSVKLKAY